MSDLDTLPPFLFSAALDTNSTGQIVGRCWFSASNPNASAAVFWNAGAWVDINNLLEAGATLELTSAIAVNDAGMLLAHGIASGGRGCRRSHACWAGERRLRSGW
jgi:uncharacterized membrane protein